MPTFDVVSEIDSQEVKNAVDQTAREIGTRFDFKNTNTSIELGDGEITLEANTEDRLAALRQVLEEKLVKRKVSLKVLDYQKVQEASGGKARQVVKLQAGINSEKARALDLEFFDVHQPSASPPASTHPPNPSDIDATSSYPICCIVSAASADLFPRAQ